MLQSPEKLTLPIGINMFAGWMIRGIYKHQSSAVATMAMVPVLIVFLLGQRQFIQGITLSGMKG